MAATKLLSDNGVTSGITGYQLTGGNDGTLQLQTTTAGGTATTALTIGTDQSTTLAGTLNLAGQNMTPYTGFKNRIINGAMMIDQRNAGASVTPSSGLTQYLLDRWMLEYSQTSKLTIQQNAGSVTPPAGFKNYLGITVAATATVGASDYFDFQQKVEGLNLYDLAWGTASAAAVTLSFWVRSSVTGQFGGSLRNGAANRSYPFAYTISAANTWEQKSITVLGDTSGTWSTTNDIGLSLVFSLGIGSTYTGTAGSWASANYGNSTGSTSIMGTSGATFYITGVQLEKGSTATSFDYRPYGTELALCQRYYYGVTHGGVVVDGWANDINVYISSRYTHPVPMRAAPTATDVAATWTFSNKAASDNMTPNWATVNSYSYVLRGASAGSRVYAVITANNATTGCTSTFSAEL